jgi:hypothetical protein
MTGVADEQSIGWGEIDLRLFRAGDDLERFASGLNEERVRSRKNLTIKT